MWSLYQFLLLLVVACSIALAGELTFELPDNERQCFYEEIDKGVKCTLEFQVITGGNYDVDMDLTAPNDQLLYKDQKKQYDSFTWTTDMKGEYRFCFSNEFSTFSHKIIYFDFQVGEDGPVSVDEGEHATAMTQMETSAVTMHEALKVIVDYQTHHRLRESQGRSFAEDLNERVQLWSMGQSVVILLVGIGQIIILKSFFTDRKTGAALSHLNT